MTLALTGKTPMRRTVLVVAAFFAIIGATLAGLWAVNTAFAHSNQVTGQANCQSDGTYTIVWTIKNDYSMSDTINKVLLNNAGSDLKSGLSVNPIPPSPGTPYQFATLTTAGIPGTSSGATLDVWARWSDGYPQTGNPAYTPDGRHDSGSVVLEGTCVPGTGKIQVHKYLWDPTAKSGAGDWKPNAQGGNRELDFHFKVNEIADSDFEDIAQGDPGGGYTAPMGDYTLSEITPAPGGYQFVAFFNAENNGTQCLNPGNAPNGPTPTGTNSVAVTVGFNNTTHVCAYDAPTPPANGFIEVYKVVTNVTDDATLFDANIDGGTSFTFSELAFSGNHPVPVGPHTVTELAEAGYTTLGWALGTPGGSPVCPASSTSKAGFVSVGNNVANIEVLSNNTTIVCFYNEKAAQVVKRTLYVDKVILGENPDNATEFSGISGTNDAAVGIAWHATNNAAPYLVSDELDPAAYLVFEDAKVGYTLKGFSVRYGPETACPSAPESTGTKGEANLTDTNTIALVCVYNEKAAPKPVDVVFSKYICDSYGDVPANSAGGQNDIGKNDGPTGLTHEDLGSAQGSSCALASTPWTFNLSKSDGTELQEVTVTGKASVTLNTDVMAYIAKAGYVEVREVYQPGYGFGALKCSGDGANDDNWEWLSIPAGTAIPMLSCTAYNVPATGKLVVHKQITDGSPLESLTVFSGTIDGAGTWSLTGTGGKTGEIALPIGTHTVEETGATTLGWVRADSGLLAPWNENFGCPASPAAYTLTSSLVAVDKTTEVCILNAKTPEVIERTLFVKKVVLGSVVDNATLFGGVVDSLVNLTWQTTNGVADQVSSTLQPGVYHVHEDAEAGYALKGFAVRYTGEGTVCPAAPETTGTEGIADLSSTNLVATVCVYNEPLVNISVHKTEQNGLFTSDGAGWKVTLSGCGITPVTKMTDALGNASFENQPLCGTYLVSEDLASKAPLPYVVAGSYASSYALNATTPGQTYSVLFANVLWSPPPFCVFGCEPTTPETPTVTATPETPTATATQPVVITTPTATPTEIEIVEGEKTPGQQATPIAPETGSGSGGGSGMNIVLAGLGLAAASLGMATLALGRRRTR